MASSITSRFNILATTQISLTLTTNPSRREHITLPFPEFPLGPQCVPEADELKLWAKAHPTGAENTQTWPCQLSFLTTPSWCLGGFPTQESSLVTNFITNKWGNHNLMHLLPLKSPPLLLQCRRSQACRFWFTVDHSCSWLQSLKGERKQIHLGTSACQWCSPCPNRWEYMTLHIPWGLRIIFLIIFIPLNNSSGWLAATLCNV